MGVNDTTLKSMEPVNVRGVSEAVAAQLAAANLAGGIRAADSGSIDAFGRWRVADPQNVFDAQFTYDLRPLIYEQVTAESGATISHDTTNRAALMTFSDTPTGGKTFMQSYEYMRYQPGKSQQIDITFDMGEGVLNVLKFAGYSDGVNGIEFILNETVPAVRILSGTDEGDETVAQSAWNLDPLDGTGTSGITLDVSKTQIFVIDFQALYVGRVRCGFNIDGLTYYVHEFLHANKATFSYIQSANLPVRCGMTCVGTVSTTMRFYCSSVISEGGQDDNSGDVFSETYGVVAASGARTHMVSLRPLTTFNSIGNRTKFVLQSIELTVTGNSPVKWELCIGQAITGTTTFTAVNSTYSAYGINTSGTVSGAPAVSFLRGVVGASNQAKGSTQADISSRYPITLDVAGAVRLLGTLTAVVEGVGGASQCYMTITWKEVR